jgi:hypothetical protein
MAQTGFTPILIYSSSTAAAAPSASNLTNSTLGSELAINITDGKLFYKDNANAIQVIGWKVVPATAGGTGQTSYAVGDILYANTTTTLAKLADVATGNALISGGVGVAPLWGKIGLTTHVSGTLPVGNGGTGTPTTFTAGSVVFAGASGIYSQDNSNFFWDAANVRLGIDTATPACTLDVVGGIQTSRTAVTSPAATDGNVFSGTYTPSQVSTNINVDSVSFAACQYMRVGAVVTVSGQITIDATTATTDTVVRISIPIASNFGASAQLGGVGSSFSVPYGLNNIAFVGDTTNDCAELRLRPSVNTSLIYNFSFTYRII